MYKKLIEDFRNHCMKEYPREACGIITLNYEYIPCKNISKQPLETFILEPFALVKYDRNIWGIAHSHPGDSSPYPSKRDKIDPLLKDYKFIVGNATETFIYWLEKEELVIEKFEESHVS